MFEVFEYARKVSSVDSQVKTFGEVALSVFRSVASREEI